VRVPGQVHPFILLEGLLDEPLLLTRDESDRLHVLSNVCTHRGTIVCEGDGLLKGLRCRYHGRRFALDGSFVYMPEFEETKDFPSKADDLPHIPFGAREPIIWVSLDPAAPLDDILKPVEERIGCLDLSKLVADASRSREYLVRANWALYCDNYLEGFHIPYVHPSLNEVIDQSSYRTELHPWGSVQVAEARPGDEAFDLPDTSPDRGRRIAAYYFWLFPNTMLNFYPWGLSVNIVKPLAVDACRVTYLGWTWDPSRLGRGAGGDLDRVEREDEAVVEAVQKGVRSRSYDRGRYSPSRDTGVHHFHRLLSQALSG
jgi:choline monooxygenase